jgi:hypothetical protein
MLLIETHRGQDGGSYKSKGFSEGPVFFSYEELSKEERNGLRDLPHNNNIRIESRAGSFGGKTAEPAADVDTKNSRENTLPW